MFIINCHPVHLYFPIFSKSDSGPVSVICLDHYVPRLGHRKGGLCLFIERTFEIFSQPSSKALYLKLTVITMISLSFTEDRFYVLTSDDEADLRSWFRAMRTNVSNQIEVIRRQLRPNSFFHAQCGLIGDEPIFGVDMEEVASRPSSKNHIPLIITKTISHLYNTGIFLQFPVLLCSYKFSSVNIGWIIPTTREPGHSRATEKAI